MTIGIPELPELTKKFLPGGERPTEFEIRGLLRALRDVLMSQPTYLELDAPVKVCGDFHGQYHDLIRVFEKEGYPPAANYLFLGDYVDRGKCGIETFCLLACFKVMYPENLFLLRGNHEVACINRIYGFYDECKRRYNIKVWKYFTDAFNCLPFAGSVGGRIFCVHGGLSPDLTAPGDLDRLRSIPRPCDVPDQGLICDLLWSDPDAEYTGWAESDRGVSFSFGPNVVADFLKAFSMDLVVRAHQVVEYGYNFPTRCRSIVTVFSATAYSGGFDNDGAVMTIDSTLLCSFTVYTPPTRRARAAVSVKS